jgi:hypothetical protein
LIPNICGAQAARLIDAPEGRRCHRGWDQRAVFREDAARLSKQRSECISPRHVTEYRTDVCRSPVVHDQSIRELHRQVPIEASEPIPRHIQVTWPLLISLQPTAGSVHGELLSE